MLALIVVPAPLPDMIFTTDNLTASMTRVRKRSVFVFLSVFVEGRVHAVRLGVNVNLCENCVGTRAVA